MVILSGKRTVSGQLPGELLGSTEGAILIFIIRRISQVPKQGSV
jgi:hypothetical protein